MSSPNSLEQVAVIIDGLCHFDGVARLPLPAHRPTMQAIGILELLLKQAGGFEIIYRVSNTSGVALFDISHPDGTKLDKTKFINQLTTTASELIKTPLREERNEITNLRGRGNLKIRVESRTMTIYTGLKAPRTRRAVRVDIAEINWLCVIKTKRGRYLASVNHNLNIGETIEFKSRNISKLTGRVHQKEIQPDLLKS